MVIVQTTSLEENGNAKKNIPKRRFYMVYNLLNYNGNNAKIKKGLSSL